MNLNLNIQKEQSPVSSDVSITSIKNSIKADLESTSSLLNSDDMFQIARLLADNPPNPSMMVVARFCIF